MIVVRATTGPRDRHRGRRVCSPLPSQRQLADCRNNRARVVRRGGHAASTETCRRSRTGTWAAYAIHPIPMPYGRRIEVLPVALRTKPISKLPCRRPIFVLNNHPAFDVMVAVVFVALFPSADDKPKINRCWTVRPVDAETALVIV